MVLDGSVFPLKFLMCDGVTRLPAEVSVGFGSFFTEKFQILFSA